MFSSFRLIGLWLVGFGSDWLSSRFGACLIFSRSNCFPAEIPSANIPFNADPAPGSTDLRLQTGLHYASILTLFFGRVFLMTAYVTTWNK